jgi:two-component system NarL family sensor kinase
MSREFSERTRIETKVLGATAQLNNSLSSAARAALVRIVQEALANIEKHSAATRVVLDLQEGNGLLTLTIRDDGHGFCRLIDRESGAGLGVSNMRERLAEIGGTLTLRFAPASTEVVAQAPLLPSTPLRKHESGRALTRISP